MSLPACTDEEFIALWDKYKSPSAVAKYLQIALRAVQARRRRIEDFYGIVLETNNPNKISISINRQEAIDSQNLRLQETRRSVRRGVVLEDATVFVFSDAHFYPQDYTTAFRALLYFIKELKPEVIVCNGDAFDGARLSRYPRINWTNTPSVKEELDAVKDHLDQIEEASTFKSNLIWCMGNHDSRFETTLSNSSAHNYEGIKGFTLKDHFPIWQPCWSFWINEDTIIKHRNKGGRYAGYNNAMQTLGKNIITGHTHVLAVQPISAFQKTIYGVQTGCLAYPDGDQFVDYTEDNPKDWRSGFAILTFHKGQLLMPELVQVFDENEGLVQFRGKVYNV